GQEPPPQCRHARQPTRLPALHGRDLVHVVQLEDGDGDGRVGLGRGDGLDGQPLGAGAAGEEGEGEDEERAAHGRAGGCVGGGSYRSGRVPSPGRSSGRPMRSRSKGTPPSTTVSTSSSRKPNRSKTGRLKTLAAV